MDFSNVRPEGLHSDWFLSSPITTFAESNNELAYFDSYSKKSNSEEYPTHGMYTQGKISLKSY